MSEIRSQARDFLTSLQDEITSSLDSVNHATFREDHWERAHDAGSGAQSSTSMSHKGGGGRTRVYGDEGRVLEKGGVNFSEVFGEFNPDFAKSIPLGDGNEFYATGVSLVLHPRSPMIPTVHANYRFLQRGSASWFGGGADLTPTYVFEDDAVHFHLVHYEALRPYGKHRYEEFKKNCDDYFFLPHRNETRGVGGIFFDYLPATPENFDLVKSCARAFLKAYLPIVEKRSQLNYTPEQKEFQEYRRGRYVEFNLIYDRGTVFGLKTGGRTESILMSLPLKARWHYDFVPKSGTPEAALSSYLKPRDWLQLGTPVS